MIFSKQVLIALFVTLCYITITQAGILDGRVEPISDQEEEKIRQNVYKGCGINELQTEQKQIDRGDRVAKEQFLRKVKCAMACALKTIGVTIDDKQLNQQVVRYVPEMKLAFGTTYVGCPQEQLYEKCSQIKDSDRCEYAWNVYECIRMICLGLKHQETLEKH